MKVLLCERNFAGHRKGYVEGLLNVNGIEYYVYAPENVGAQEKHFYRYNLPNGIVGYIKWINEISNIVKRHKIDVVHILDGDSIMRYFGLGMSRIPSRKRVITYHHFWSGVLRKISYQMMNRGKKNLCVAHTMSVKRELEEIGLSRVELCKYPAFDFYELSKKDAQGAKKYFGLSEHVPVIGIVGGMSKYKNIIPFLNAIKECNEPFQIFLAGRVVDVSREELEDACCTYSDKVCYAIRQLSLEEYQMAICASDIIYSIYGLDFDGASGPLTDGVCAKKYILSCNHGSLGEIVEEHKVGITADCTSAQDMLQKVRIALHESKGFHYGEEANAYRDSLRPENFFKTYKSIYED